MKWYYLFVFLFLFFFSKSQVTLTPQELQEDFNQFKEELYKRNKGLHLFIDEEDYAAYLGNIEDQLNEEKSLLAFYELLRKAIIPVQERHLSINGFHKKSDFAKRIKAKDSTAIRFFPLLVYFQDNNNAFAIRNAWRDSTLHLPSKVLTINGEAISDLRDEMAKYLTQDFGVTTWRNWELSQTFPLQYYRHIDTTSTFVVEWQDSLAQYHIDTLKGMPIKPYRDSIKKQSKAFYQVEHFKPGLRYRIIDSLQTGYLKIRSFKANKQKFENQTIKFKQIVKEFFEQVEANEVQHVIIDVRNNTGGSVRLLRYLLAYIQPNEQKELMYRQLKDRNYWWGEVLREKTTRKQRQPHFDGQIYVLTNGGSYSAAVMFAVYAKRFNDATIVGEPAGGRSTGTSAGSFHIERLKHSDVLVRIPETVFYYSHDGEVSIEPDLYVKPKLEDFFSYEKDHQLDTLLKMIQGE